MGLDGDSLDLDQDQGHQKDSNEVGHEININSQTYPTIYLHTI